MLCRRSAVLILSSLLVLGGGDALGQRRAPPWKGKGRGKGRDKHDRGRGGDHPDKGKRRKPPSADRGWKVRKPPRIKHFRPTMGPPRNGGHDSRQVLRRKHPGAFQRAAAARHLLRLQASSGADPAPRRQRQLRRLQGRLSGRRQRRPLRGHPAAADQALPATARRSRDLDPHSWAQLHQHRHRGDRQAPAQDHFVRAAADRRGRGPSPGPSSWRGPTRSTLSNAPSATADYRSSRSSPTSSSCARYSSTSASTRLGPAGRCGSASWS